MKKYIIYSMTAVFALSAVLTACKKDKNDAIPVTGVTLNGTSVTLAPTDTVTLIATVLPEDATNKDVTWASDNPDVATVDNGTVTAKAEGTATITVTTVDGNKTATCVVTVSNAAIPVTGVTLDQETLTLSVDGTATLAATVLPEDATNKDVTWASDNPDVATVDNGIVTAKAAGTATITVTTVDGNKSATCTLTVYDDTEKGVVINGIRWATRNVDAPGHFAAKPEDAGMFYQWNRKVGWSSTDPMINSDGGTTWDASKPIGNTWDKANDPSPAGWRVPTKEELESLANTTYVTHEWTTENGVNGYRCTDKATGNSLFLPAAGYRYVSDGSLNVAGSYGFYWSSTPDTTNTNVAYRLNFSSGYFSTVSITNRTFGHSVRCVAE